MTWLPGNINSVPLSFNFQVKCTSLSELLQAMSAGATAERKDDIKKRENASKKSKKGGENEALSEKMGC